MEVKKDITLFCLLLDTYLKKFPILHIFMGYGMHVEGVVLSPEYKISSKVVWRQF